MVILKFQGYSDDTFGEYAHFNEDHDNCANGRPIVYRVASPGDQCGLLVWGQYAGRDWPEAAPGCWMIGVQQLGEDEPLPGWLLNFYGDSDTPYSPALEIHAPDDVTLTPVT